LADSPASLSDPPTYRQAVKRPRVELIPAASFPTVTPVRIGDLDIDRLSFAAWLGIERMA